MERNVLCKMDDIPQGETKVFQIRRMSIVVIRKEGEFYALRNWCPHQGAELDKGVLRGAARATSDVKEVCYEKPGKFLYCPWHHWSFDIENGCSMHDPENTKVKTYDVKIEGDDLVIYA
ncbi:Rieske (2Fe-2S) protein [Alkalihalobacillus sp. BA299]|uniref:Rieske (2Fe-2S) protein n=1 Tax=Alkalihalobacillus sp. BA299 TaxID=2815938 RepID=UPI001AD973BB|nr:Rieske (2Fe-2S) protein [Alkalihalobacillus sp. BA299]